ncbi:TPA: ABC transporter ATP-binding protein [bacterium]|nr:ABC transporter ATP-binding protein [bacterium]
MISIKNVTKKFGDFKAVDGLTLDILSGEIFGFLGPNGAGKTTTIKMMTGILSPNEGDIVINGYSIVKEPLEAKRQFGFVPDSPDLFLRLKGIEYLNFIGDVYEVDSETRQQRIMELTKKLEIDDALNDRLITYSHGMRQKIIIIGALLHQPKVWILDEPLTGLDPRSSAVLKEMMNEHVSKGNTVFFSTHVLDTAEKICDRVGIINKGKLIFVGSLQEMREHASENKSLERMFLEMTDDE